MKIAVRKSDNFIMPDFQVPGHADGIYIQLAVTRYGGVIQDYMEIEVPQEMINPIFQGTHYPVWDGEKLSLAPHVKTQAELDAEALVAALAKDAADIHALDWSTITTLVEARAVIKKLARLSRQKAL